MKGAACPCGFRIPSRPGVARGTVEREESDLAREAEFVLPLRCGQERAVAATKSYLASLTVPLPLIAALRGDAGLTRALETLPEALEGTLGLEGQAGDLAERYRFVESLLVLARGLHYGVGQQGEHQHRAAAGAGHHLRMRCPLLCLAGDLPGVALSPCRYLRLEEKAQVS